MEFPLTFPFSRHFPRLPPEAMMSCDSTASVALKAQQEPRKNHDILTIFIIMINHYYQNEYNYYYVYHY